MVYLCNKKDSNRDYSLDSLLDICNSWVDRFSKKLVSSGLNPSERGLRNLYFGAEMIVYCYRDMERSSEKAYAFEHPLAINDLLLDTYNHIYKEKVADSKGIKVHKIRPPADFISCYRNNYFKISHTAFFHDAIELKLIDNDANASARFISGLYNGLEMDGDEISSYVSMMSLPKAADDYTIKKYLDRLEKHPIPFFVKIGDAMHNSETRGSERQFGKMTNHYSEKIRKRFRALYPYFYRNICNNYIDKIFGIPLKREPPENILNCLATSFDELKSVIKS